MRWSSPPAKMSRFANSLRPIRPTTMAATRPSSGDPVAQAAVKPANAPAYIVPSMPRLSTPLRSA